MGEREVHLCANNVLRLEWGCPLSRGPDANAVGVRCTRTGFAPSSKHEFDDESALSRSHRVTSALRPAQSLGDSEVIYLFQREEDAEKKDLG
jgi:hypothetical protein